MRYAVSSVRRKKRRPGCTSKRKETPVIQPLPDRIQPLNPSPRTPVQQLKPPAKGKEIALDDTQVDSCHAPVKSTPVRAQNPHEFCQRVFDYKSCGMYARIRTRANISIYVSYPARKSGLHRSGVDFTMGRVSFEPPGRHDNTSWA